MHELKIPTFSSAKVLVVGDAMLDWYWSGMAERISPEAPVPVIRINQKEERPGGAGNVALNLAAIDVETDLIALLGEDEAGKLLTHKLQAANVRCHFHSVATHKTITKLRVMSIHQQLLRLDFEENFLDEHAQALQSLFEEKIASVGAVIFSDYGKGTLSQVSTLINIARAKKIPILVDPKGRDFSRYRGATLLTPNYKEFEIVVGSCQHEHTIIERARNLIADHHLEALLITRGAQGMTLIPAKGEPTHLPAHALEVFDVSGAGDTVIAFIAATLAVGEKLELGVVIANRAAGITVGKLGAATVSLPELRAAMRGGAVLNRGVVTEEQLLELCHNAKLAGERLVMTNGCFDLLHLGHVTYLEQAKALGDRLIVAVNDDPSVATLKGPDRPINNLERRMGVLSRLQAVDWVVPFSEDTPARLIETVLPDVLVKGGDYQVPQIAGAQAVLENRGSVEILEFVEGCSSSAMINKITKKKE